MVQRPYWETNSSSASQECPHIFWNPTFQYHFHNKRPLDSVLGQMNAVYTLPLYLRSTLILSSYLLVYLPRGFFLSRFPFKPCMHLFDSSSPLVTYLIHLRLVTQQIFHLNGLKAWISLLHNFLQPPYTSAFLCLYVFLSNLFSYAFTQWRFYVGVQIMHLC
jgi:hypothetical protein